MSPAPNHRAAPANPAESRRRLINWLLVLVGLLFLVAIPWTIIDAMGRAALQHQIERIRASGAPVTVADLRNSLPEVPEDQDAVLIVSQAMGALAPEVLDLRAKPYLPFLGRYNLPPVTVPIDERAIVEASDALARMKDALSKIERAASMGTGVIGIPESYLTSVVTDQTHIRTASNVLQLASFQRLVEGELEAAADGIVTVFGLSDVWDNNPRLLCQLGVATNDIWAARMIERLLGTGELPEESLVLLQQNMAQAEPRRDITVAVQAERAMIIDIITSGISISEFPGYWAAWYARGYMFGQLAEALKNLEPLARRYETNVEWLDALRTYNRTAAGGWTGVGMLLPHPRPFFYLLRRRALMRTAVAALAAERFRLRHGRWPAGANELIPEFIDTEPLDPFTDTPLIWRIDTSGLTIYSVGEDGLDDGGQIDPESQNTSKSLDVGIRLINPETRAFRIKPAPEDE